MSFASSPNETSGSTGGATCLSEHTFATVKSSRERKIARRVIIPAYFPFSSKTAITGGIPFLKPSRHLDSVSLSCTKFSPLEYTSLAVIDVLINNH